MTYKSNEKFLKYFNRFKYDKISRDKLKLAMIYLKYKRLIKRKFFFLWLIKILKILRDESKNFKKNSDYSITKFQTFYITELTRKQAITLKKFEIDKSSEFYFLSDYDNKLDQNYAKLGFKIIIRKLLYEIFLERKNFFFRNLLRYSCFKTTQKNLLLFKNILLNKKLKFILKNKFYREKRFYFKKLSNMSGGVKFDESKMKVEQSVKEEFKFTRSTHFLHNKPKFQESFVINSIRDQSERKKFHLLIFKQVLKLFSILNEKNMNSLKSDNNSIRMKHYLTLWKFRNIKSKLLEQDLLIEDYKSTIQDFTAKFHQIEKSFSQNLNRIRALETSNSEKEKEISNMKKIISEKSQKIQQLEKTVSTSDSEEPVRICNTLSHSHTDILPSTNSTPRYKEFQALHQENNQLQQKCEELEKTLKSFRESEIRRKENTVTDQTLREIENKVFILTSLNDKLKSEISEKTQKYENLKKISNETAEELIQTNNELMKIKTENRNLLQKVSKFDEVIDKLNNEINTKDRNIRQLKLNEDSLMHQFKLEKERLEQRILNEKSNLNEKIELYEKEVDYYKDQIKSLSKENKNLGDKLRNYVDYNSIKNEVLHLRDKVVNYENENDTLKLQNINLQKQIERLVESLANESKKYETAKYEVILINIYK